MIWGDGITHDAQYRPQDMGRDWVTALCGERIHISEFYGLTTLTCPKCKTARVRIRLKALRESKPSYLSMMRSA